MRAAWERDAAVGRVSVLTRAAVAASVALSLALTALVAWAQPGRAKSAGAHNGNPAPFSSPPANSSNGSDDSSATSPSNVVAPPDSVAPDTLPPSAYTPQPYVGSDGGGIVSGQS